MDNTEESKMKAIKENMDSTDKPSESQDYISMLGWNIVTNTSNYYNPDVIQDYPLSTVFASVTLSGATITALYQLYHSNVKINLPTATLVGLGSAVSVWYAHNTDKIEEILPVTQGLHSFIANCAYYLHDSSIFTKDVMYGAGIVIKDKMYDAGIVTKDAIYDVGIFAKDKIYDAGVVTKDKMYDVGIVTKDTMYDVGIFTKDKIYDAGVVTKDAIYELACIIGNYTTELAGKLHDQFAYP